MTVVTIGKAGPVFNYDISSYINCLNSGTSKWKQWMIFLLRMRGGTTQKMTLCLIPETKEHLKILTKEILSDYHLVLLQYQNIDFEISLSTETIQISEPFGNQQNSIVS